MISENDYCERCELFNGDIEDGVCAYCRADEAFIGERGTLFRAGGDGEPAFVGFDTGRTWNGWCVPEFDFDEALAIVRYLETLGHASTVHVTNSDAVTLVYRDNATGEFVEVQKNTHGRFVFDGWTWEALDVATDENDNALEALEERFRVDHVLAAKVAMGWRDELLEDFAWRFESESVARFPMLVDWLTNA